MLGMATPNILIPDTLPAPLTVYYGWLGASKTITFPAGTPITPATNQPYRDDARDHIVAWIVTDDLELPDFAWGWASTYGFPVYRDQLEELTALRAAAGE